jgi:hypothetical protein
MASRKRFIDSDLFQDEWFIDLEPKYKLAWIYLMTNCGHDGIWKVSQKLLSFNVGENVETVGLKRALGSRVVELDEGRLWFIPKFITFQYGTNLSKNNAVLKQFFEMDEKYNLLPYIELEAPNEELPSPSRGATSRGYSIGKGIGKDKIKYAEFVSMTEEQYGKLIERMGSESKVKTAIEILDNYKGSKGKQYKDDYRAILSWVVDEVKKRAPSLKQQIEELPRL